MSASRKKQGTAGPKKKRTPSTKAKVASQKGKAAVAEVLREGSPAMIATRRADREQKGEVRRNLDEVEITPEDLMDEEAMDSEIEMADEDDADLDDLDESENWGGSRSVRPAETFYRENFAEDGEDDEPARFEIRVEEDGEAVSCRFDPPGWMRGEAASDEAEEDLDQLDHRYGMFDQIAAWLTTHRPAFLKNADPVALAPEALEDMEASRSPVTPAGFLELSGIRDRVVAETEIEAKSVDSLFSRYCSATCLVWEDGSTLPLEFLFGHEARNAWVACAVKQLFKSKNLSLDAKRIDSLSKITVPKRATEKEKLRGKAFTSLNQKDFVAKANLLAETSWKEVVELHFNPKTTE